MKESNDNPASVLVLVVTASGEDEAAIEALRSDVRNYVKTLPEKDIVPGSEPPVQRGTALADVNLSRYLNIQQAVRFINDKFRTDIRLAAVAREAGMSASHFSRVFSKVMGFSYQEYLNNRRITEARNLLRTSVRSVSEIAVSLGFADATGFGRIFKKLTGHTPSAYRSLPKSRILPKKA